MRQFWITQNIFPFLSKALWSKINNCYCSLFSNLKRKKNTTLLVDLLAVTCVPWILKSPVYHHVQFKFIMTVLWVISLHSNKLLFRASLSLLLLVAISWDQYSVTFWYFKLYFWISASIYHGISFHNTIVNRVTVWIVFHIPNFQCQPS